MWSKVFLIPLPMCLVFESEVEEIKKFAIKHQIVENGSDVLYREDHDNDHFIIEAIIDI